MRFSVRGIALQAERFKPLVDWLPVDGKSRVRTTRTADRAPAEKQLAQVEAMFGAHKSGSLTQELFEALTGKIMLRKTLQAALEDWWTESEAQCRSTRAGNTGLLERVSPSLSARRIPGRC